MEGPLGYCGATPASPGDFLVSPSIFMLGERCISFFSIEPSLCKARLALQHWCSGPHHASSLCGVQEALSLTPLLLLAGGLKLMAAAQPSKYFLCFPADSSQPLSGWLPLMFEHWLGDASCRAASWPCMRWAQLLAAGAFHPSMRPWSWGLRKHLSAPNSWSEQAWPLLNWSYWKLSQWSQQEPAHGAEPGVMLMACEPPSVSSLSYCPPCPDPWEHRAAG